MGGGGSQTVEQTFNMKALNKSIFNQITTNQQTLSASMDNKQSVFFDIVEMGKDCDVDITQEINANLQSSAVMSPTTIAETKDQVKNDLKASGEAALEKETEAGNFQFGDKQAMNTKINQEVENIVEKTFETKNLNETVSKMVNVQEGRIKIGYCNGKLKLNQNIVAELMAEAITESLTSAISDNETLNSLAGDSKSKGKTTNKGLADIVGTFFAGITGPLKYLMIACVICVCVICLGGTVFLLSPSGQKSSETLASAGASRLKGRPF